MYKSLAEFEKDQTDEIRCPVEGKIPDWLDGSLYRTGPGQIKFGPDQYAHLFDGMALMHKYRLKDGEMWYQNRTLESGSYKRNKAANRIVAGEFGNTEHPDPCRSIFTRYFTYMLGFDSTTDNTLVNIIRLGDQLYAMTETQSMNRIDPDDLKLLKTVDLSKLVAVHFATAHPLQEKDGTTYNIGTRIGRQTYYNVVKIPRPIPGEPCPVDKIEQVGQIPSSFGHNPCYSHSFGLTENYIIFIEQPLLLNVMRLFMGKITGASFRECLNFHDDIQTRFHVMHKHTGSLLTTTYVAQPLFVFHHINAYEEDQQIVMDIAAYENSDVIDRLLLAELRDKPDVPAPASQFWRFVLPLQVNQDYKDNMVTLANTTSTAVVTPDGAVLCTPEKITDSHIELPRINEKYTAKKYRYCYAMDITCVNKGELQKYDIESKTVKSWKCEGYMPGEPVFIANPDHTEEDDGIILSPVHAAQDDLDSFLVVLDGATFAELARARVPVTVPFSFHGIFTNIETKN